jgi:hypothetical protein
VDNRRYKRILYEVLVTLRKAKMSLSCYIRGDNPISMETPP